MNKSQRVVFSDSPCIGLHRVSRKLGPPKLMTVTSSNLSRFSSSFTVGKFV